MFISPEVAIREGWIKFPEWMSQEFRDKCVQPNAIDFTLDKLYSHSDFTPFVLNESRKMMRQVIEQYPIPYNGYDDSMYLLEQNQTYDAQSDFYVTVPDGVAASLIIRSTLNRNAIFLTSGLYDTGFEGNIGFALHNRSINSRAYIGQHTRVGQIIFIEAANAGIYKGGWNTANGQHWSQLDGKQ